MRRRLLTLTWLDAGGEAYHTATVGPAAARGLLAREPWPRLYLDGAPHPLGHLTHAALARCRRAARAVWEDGRACVIALADDA